MFFIENSVRYKMCDYVFQKQVRTQYISEKVSIKTVTLNQFLVSFKVFNLLLPLLYTLYTINPNLCFIEPIQELSEPIANDY